MATEPGPDPGPNRLDGQQQPSSSSQSNESNHLQQFYDESSTKEPAAEQDEESLFAELYGKQDGVKDITESQTNETAMKDDEEGGNEEESGSEEEETDDDADQDVKIILMSSSDAARPPSGRAAPNKYIRQDASQAAAAAAATAAAPMMSTDGEIGAADSHDDAVAAQTKSSQRAIAKMIPEQPEPIDSNGQPITFPSVYDVDIDALPEKPWKNPQADLSDWFNYGFDEDSWRSYCQRQVQMRLSVTKPRKQKPPHFEQHPAAHPMPPQGGHHPMGQQHHHRKPGPITANVPPPHRPHHQHPISQDVLQLGGGSNFVESAAHMDPRHRPPPRYEMQQHPYHQHKPPMEHRTAPPPIPNHDPGKPPIPSGSRFKEVDNPSDPRSRPPPRHPSPARHEVPVRGREDSREHSRSRFEGPRHSSERERRESSSSRPTSSSAYEKRGRSPPRDSHYESKHREADRRGRSADRDHRREYERREASHREKRPRSPVPSSRDYDAKRRR